MKKQTVISFLFLLSFASTAWTASWDETIPMNSAEERADAFLRIWNLIPSVGDGAVRYNVDPVALFNSQVLIGQTMTSNGVYQNLLRDHRELIQFTTFEGTQATTSDSSDKESSWQQFKQRSIEYTQSLGLKDTQSIEQEISRLASSPLTGKTQGLIVGLAQILPNELKKPFFALSLDDKIRTLEQYLPPEVVAKGFDPTRLGWNDTAISKEDIISRLKTATHNDHALTALIATDYAAVAKNLTSPKDYTKKWQGPLVKVIEQTFGALAKTIPQGKPTQAVVTRLTLREVPPVVGMFRGFAGNDCSTKFSFPFVNSPNEYTFLAYNNKGQLKGYVQGTKVRSNGQSAFYLHTIAGPRISAQDAFEIMSVIHQQRDKLGAKEILLPTKDRMELMINFLPIREAMARASSATVRQVDYADHEIREQFKAQFKITKEYDDAKTNRDAFVLDVSLLKPVQVQTSETPSLNTVSTSVERNSLFKILVQLGKNNVRNVKDSSYNNDKMIGVLAPRIGLTLDDVKSLVLNVNNISGLPKDELFRDVEKRLSRLGFEMPTNETEKVSLLANGLLRSKDLISDPQLTRQVLEILFEQRAIKSVGEFLKDNPSLLHDRKITTAYIEAFYNDFHEGDHGTQKPLQSALSINARVIMEDRHLLEILLRSSAATETLIEFLEKRPQFKFKLVNLPEGRQLLAKQDEGVRVIADQAAQLLATKSEKEFMKVFYGHDAFKTNYTLKRIFERKVMARVIDHYLKLSPTEKVSDIVFLFANATEQEVSYERELRRLIPVAMQVSGNRDLNLLISTFIDKKEGSSVPKRYVDAIIAGLRKRPDFNTLNESDLISMKRLREFNWQTRTIVRCENLF